MAQPVSHWAMASRGQENGFTSQPCVSFFSQKTHLVMLPQASSLGMISICLHLHLGSVMPRCRWLAPFNTCTPIHHKTHHSMLLRCSTGSTTQMELSSRSQWVQIPVNHHLLSKSTNHVVYKHTLTKFFHRTIREYVLSPGTKTTGTRKILMSLMDQASPMGMAFIPVSLSPW